VECVSDDRTLRKGVFPAIKGWEKKGCPALFPKKEAGLTKEDGWLDTEIYS
jgi:hypothetical protein